MPSQLYEILAQGVLKAVSKNQDEVVNNVKKFFNTTRRPYIIQGAKRKYFNSYASKLRYECLREIFNNTNDKKQRKVYVTLLYYWWKHIDNIILGSPNYLETLVTRWDIIKMEVLSCRRY